MQTLNPLELRAVSGGTLSTNPGAIPGLLHPFLPVPRPPILLPIVGGPVTTPPLR